jgi:4-aminobutyrate aminotransferase/(S)-3-amino-2-methylpropionate transaminase
MIVTAKGIAGGLPLAAVTARAEIMDSSHVGGIGGTYGGNPIACAAALGAIETIEKENLVERAREIEKILFATLGAIAAKHPEIGDIRGRGAMVAIELVKAESKDPNPELMAKVIKYCQSKGVLILTAGSYGNVIRFLPPLVISDELLNDALSVLAEAFDTVA